MMTQERADVGMYWKRGVRRPNANSTSAATTITCYMLQYLNVLEGGCEETQRQQYQRRYKHDMLPVTMRSGYGQIKYLISAAKYISDDCTPAN